MLKSVLNSRKSSARARVAIVASKYNGKFVDGMLSAALAELTAAGLKDVRVVRTPGAFEIPVVVAAMARAKRRRPEVVICLGVIFRGETAHADQVGGTVSRLLGQIAVETGVPVIHEVLLLVNEAQAKKRCLADKYNRGREAAVTALEMRETLREL